MSKCENFFSSAAIVHFLVLMFGAGAWIAVNGVWVELPVIVYSTPEGWTLPSYLTVILQIGNIGPVLVTVMQTFYPKYFHQNAMIYSIVGIGTLSCLLLSFFWDTTAFIAGQSRSVALFALWFCLSFVDCTSSVTFLPFMTTFQALFLSTYFIGEGLSGLLPSIFALAQGVQNVQCVNTSHTNATTNVTTYSIVAEYENARFSADIFFVLLCIMMLGCGMAFVLLNHLGVAQKFYAPPQPKYIKVKTTNNPDEEGTGFYNSVEMSSSGSTTPANLDSRISVIGKPETDQSASATVLLSAKSNQLTRGNYAYLLVIIFFVNCISNGALPAVSSYSSLPYGSLAYHLSACLGNMANPVACFIAVFLPMQSFVGNGVFTLISAALGSYLMLLAVQSPCPILINETTGTVLMILAQILFVGSVSYIKISIAQIFRSRGHKKSLIWYGAVVQAGSLIGALIMFPMVNVYSLFISSVPCDKSCF
ncbi:unnamed protein product [Clavelina lepadiformis]|uniref:Riboflavin transporter n=1 Tax=Clavelina lepadiformis TaxID=159417 RepID=A0ABP0FC35_CLALP